MKLFPPHVENDQWKATIVSAIKSGNCQIVSPILAACTHHTSLDIPILHLACKLNNGRPVVKRPAMTIDEDHITSFLVENLHLNVTSDYNKEGYTPVLLAAHFGFVYCIKYLLSTSTDGERQLGECTKDRQYNILHLCAEQARQVTTSSETDHGEIWQYILEHPTFKHVANRLLCEEDSEGNTPLHLACRRNNMRMCELLV